MPNVLHWPTCECSREINRDSVDLGLLGHREGANQLKCRRIWTMHHRDILVGSRSWSTTPWNYSSMRYIQFAEDGSGLLLYGYGQTIYAKINIRYTVKANCQIDLQYLDSPPFQRFAGFTPNNHTTKTLKYTLSEHHDTIREDATGADFSFKWLLTLDKFPFPDTLTFPYETPLEFYGYRVDLRSTKAM